MALDELGSLVAHLAPGVPLATAQPVPGPQGPVVTPVAAAAQVWSQTQFFFCFLFVKTH